MPDSPPSKPSRPLRLWLVLFWAAGHWLLLELVRFAMELIARLPLIGPRSDPVIAGLMWVEWLLVLPRLALRLLWPGESLPAGGLGALTLFNGLLWGATFHLWFLWRRR